MAGTIKVRTKLRDGRCTLRALIKHPMAFEKRLGRELPIPPRFITEVVCEHQGKQIFKSHWGLGIAKNPYLSVVFDLAAAGDTLRIRWTDNHGDSDSFETIL